MLLLLPFFILNLTVALPVVASVESSLASDGGNIRQFAFDGNAASYFASKTNPTANDHFTLRFEPAVALKSVTVQTGKPDGADILKVGVLEVSFDGTTFEKLAAFAAGRATANNRKDQVKALRLRPTEDAAGPLVVREIALESEPAVTTYRHPVEFTLDVTDAPDLKEWGEKVIRVCEQQYPMICDELASDGFRPPTRIRVSLKTSYNGVAATSGSSIVGSVKYFKEHPNDIGAMVHETAHAVQSYRGRNLPGWLVEGIADYVRFWKYEPGKAGRVNPGRAKYDGSYRTSAAFLAFVTEKYDPKAVQKLNALLRQGKYDTGAWKTLTGKSVEELNEEWKLSLAR